jgi:hypothetical protein
VFQMTARSDLRQEVFGPDQVGVNPSNERSFGGGGRETTPELRESGRWPFGGIARSASGFGLSHDAARIGRGSETCSRVNTYRLQKSMGDAWSVSSGE